MKLVRLAFIVAILPLVAFAQVKLASQKISLKNGKTFSLKVADGWEMIPAAEGLKRVRFFANAPDGRIFVTDMYNLTDNKRGTVYILDDFDKKTGKFGRVVPYLANLRNPNSVQFYTDADGQDWLYIAETDKITRRRFTKGETTPTDKKPQTIATFPDYGLSYKYGGWHLTRTLAFSPEGKLYVSVGSSCNACDEKEEVRATILEMNPDGSKQKTFAKGLRNAVGVKWREGNLFATNQGSDHLGLDRPDETFYAVKEGADYGWASCFQSNGKIFLDKSPDTDIKKPTKRLRNCANVPVSYSWFPSHSSALGFEYFGNETADEALKDAFLVSLHGSTNKDIGHGYKVVLTRKGKKLEDFISGFLQGSKVWGRPCDILKLTDDSFLLTDDFSGVVYVVRKRG